jgi:hypothetical protein
MYPKVRAHSFNASLFPFPAFPLHNQSAAATIKGAIKWMTPYGNHARTSRTGLVYRVRISEIFPPYSTDSRVGRSDTEIGGLHPVGMNREEKNVMTQASTGVAGRRNWPVNGIIMPVAYNIGMSSLNGKGGVVINVSQNVASAARNTCSAISAQVNL